jgi:beta-glucanase (GH16 family)
VGSASISRKIKTHLSLTTSYNDNQTGAEIDFASTDVLYASIRAQVRVMGDAGAVAGIFTYHNDTSESDIEIITRDEQSNIHYSNQPTTDDESHVIPGSTFNVTITGNKNWTDWQTYRLDWLPGHTVWYVNGIQTASTTVNVPQEPSSIILNMWSNGGLFSGRMAKGSQAKMDIAWIELIFNTSEGYAPTSSNQKSKVCSVDNSVGSPTSASNRCEGHRIGVWVLPALLLIFWLSV